MIAITALRRRRWAETKRAMRPENGNLFRLFLCIRILFILPPAVV